LAKVLESRLKQLKSSVDFKRHPKYREFRQKIWVQIFTLLFSSFEMHIMLEFQFTNHTPIYLLSLLQHVHHPDEALPEEQTEDLVVLRAESDSELRCPITRSLFVHPYKNTLCGHTFERDAILKILKGPPRGPKQCPIVGAGQ
jgi:hypothetical protein